MINSLFITVSFTESLRGSRRSRRGKFPYDAINLKRIQRLFRFIETWVRQKTGYLFFLFVSVLPEAFLPFVGSHFMPFPFFSAWHDVQFLNYTMVFTACVRPEALPADGAGRNPLAERRVVIDCLLLSGQSFSTV